MKDIKTDFEYQVKVIENEWIPLSDGTRLSSRIWLPQNAQKLPAILEYIPYRKNDGTRTRDEPMHGYFSGHGYVCVRVDMRGSGESDGFLYDEYLKQEQDDALEVIEWIAKQQWCDGNVGMMGKSWGGFNSLQVAARRPKHLKAIIVVGFTDDRYNDDIHYKGGCLLNDNFWWGNIMLAYQSRLIDNTIEPNGRAKWIQRLENMPLFPALWLRHSLRDDYWKHGSICEDYDAINIPVFALDGWADSYTNPVFSLMYNLKVPKKAVIGPWAHVYPHDGIPAPSYPFLQDAVKWWDKWLKNRANDTLDAPLIEAYIQEGYKPSSCVDFIKGRYVALQTPNDIEAEHYYLSYNTLQKHKNTISTTVNLCTPQSHGLLGGEWMGAGVLGESPSDQRLDDGMAMIFDSAILQENKDILGFPEFYIQLRSNKTRAMLFVQLSELRSDGSVQRISYGVSNLCHINNHSAIKELKPHETIEAKVKLDACGHTFQKGNRIRISLASTFFPMFFPMPEHATLSLDIHTAQLSLPIFKGKDSALPKQKAESAPLTPLTVLKEGRVDRNISYDILSDTWTCITDGIGGVFGEGVYKFDERDMLVEHNLKRELKIKNDDPLSALYTITQKMKIGRDGQLMDADLIFTQKADKEHFYINGTITVKENDKVIFEKEYNECIKRNGI